MGLSAPLIGTRRISIAESPESLVNILMTRMRIDAGNPSRETRRLYKSARYVCRRTDILRICHHTSDRNDSFGRKIFSTHLIAASSLAARGSLLIASES
jgi:hypothetical protein